jgi:ubiquitin related modifier 1
MKIKIELGGGLETLFGGKRAFDVEIPASVAEKGISIRALVSFVREHVVQTKPELFATGDKVRPGVLILVNDTDVEVLGGLDATVSNGDCVVFISTLHGG